MDILNKITDFLGESDKSSVTLKNPPFEPLINDIKKRFGKGSILEIDEKGSMLMVRMLRVPYIENQDQFELPTKFEWINDKGYHLVSVQSDFEPSSIKLYFCNNMTTV